jgi:hypothetical protein
MFRPDVRIVRDGVCGKYWIDVAPCVPLFPGGKEFETEAEAEAYLQKILFTQWGIKA